MSKLTEAWDKFRAIAYFADGGSMYAAITEADAEIERLTRERDEARGTWPVTDEQSTSADKMINALAAARNKALDEAVAAVKSSIFRSDVSVSIWDLDKISYAILALKEPTDENP